MASHLKDGELATDERVEIATELDSEREEANVAGTVRLFDNNTAVLIPTPSPDPKDPLNLPAWRKFLIVMLVGLYSAFAVLGTSGMGPIFSYVVAEYPPDQATKATDLLTYPTLFMGVGNLLSMPLSISIGRRPVFLFSLVLMVVTGIWCACSTSLDSHIAGRNFFSLAAGQSEALAPMMVQEIYFLHERASKVAWFVAVQTTGTAVMFVASSYFVPPWGIKWWYGIMTIVNGLILIFSYLFVVETRFDRPADATEGVVHLRLDAEGHQSTSKQAVVEKIFKVTTAQTHVLEPERYGPRTWRHDLTICHFKPDWALILTFYKETFQSLLIPSILWLMLLNGAYLGVYVYQVSSFANILMAPPYNFKSEWLGFVQVAQIIDCAFMLPILGYGSDLIVRTMSRRRGGLFHPEYRLLPLIIPAMAVIFSCVFFGRAGSHPYDWPWTAVAIPYNLGYFAFLGANTVGITYAVDAFPHKAGPLLLIICAGRGFISFGLSYSTVPLIASLGYDGAMNIFAIVCGVLSGFGIPVYIFGKQLRSMVQKRIFKEKSGQ